MKTRFLPHILSLFLPFVVTCSFAAEVVTFSIADLGVKGIRQGYGRPRKDTSTEEHPLSIGGRRFATGIGTHAESLLELELNGMATRFTAWVGVDDEAGDQGSVVFEVYADSNKVFSSGVMRGGDWAKHIDIDLTRIERMILHVGNAGDGISYDHADWAEAQLTIRGEPDEIRLAPPEEPYILTPPPPPEPRITGAKVFGIRPGRPFLFTVPATGDRPIIFKIENLPQGLRIDPRTGKITGTVMKKGIYETTIHAKNAVGEAARPFRIVVGEKICLTPPMGWNHWNVWGVQIDDQKVRECAEAFVTSDLINHGWQYINIDDGWQGKRMPPDYALQANEKFPDMKGLCEYVHELGLKIGIYSTPWRISYGNYPGGSMDTEDGQVTNRAKRVGAIRCEERDARRYADWGIDYLKYDWHTIDEHNTELMGAALRDSGRDIIYSLSNSAPYYKANEWVRLANAWRTTGDIRDSWPSMAGIGFSQDPWKPYAGPGHWNDPDMLVLGWVGWGEPHPSRLTPNEQYTHMSLWSLLSAPLLLGCDMTKLDDFTLNLLSNDEVLEVNQDPLGDQAGRVSVDGAREVWAKKMEDGSVAVGLFNRGLFPAMVTATFGDIGLEGTQRVRDVWRQKDMGTFIDTFEAEVPRHGVVLVRIWEEK